MKQTLILLGVFLSLAVFVAAQTHTFPALDTNNTWTGSNNFTGGLQSGGVNVLTNPVNLGTQVTGTLAGANYAAVNLASGNVNGGVTGVLPGANMAATNLAGGNNPGGVAGTLPGSSMATFVASGASHAPGAVPDPGASAGTTHFLREDATWATLPASGISEGTWSASNGNSPGTFVLNAQMGGTLFPSAHTLIRYTIFMSAQISGCTTSPVVAFRDITGSSNLATLTVANSTTFFDSGALSVSMTAGHEFAFQITTAGSGCSGGSSGWTATVFYQ